MLTRPNRGPSPRSFAFKKTDGRTAFRMILCPSKIFIEKRVQVFAPSLASRRLLAPPTLEKRRILWYIKTA